MEFRSDNDNDTTVTITTTTITDHKREEKEEGKEEAEMTTKKVPRKRKEFTYLSIVHLNESFR